MRFLSGQCATVAGGLMDMHKTRVGGKDARFSRPGS